MYRIEAGRLHQRPPSVQNIGKASPAEAKKRYHTDNNRINHTKRQAPQPKNNNTTTNANHANHANNTRNNNNNNNLKRKTIKPNDQDYENKLDRQISNKNRRIQGSKGWP